MLISQFISLQKHANSELRPVFLACHPHFTDDSFAIQFEMFSKKYVTMIRRVYSIFLKMNAPDCWRVIRVINCVHGL